MNRQAPIPAAVAERLLSLASQPQEPYLARDPLRFPRQYQSPKDIEIAAVLSALLAYGRVDLFGPVIARILGEMPEGPAAYVSAFNAEKAERLRPILYRWNRHPDFALLFQTLQAVYQQHPSLGSLFRAGNLKNSLSDAIQTLRALVPIPQDQWSHGFRSFLPSPEDGSACKRWLMLLRWMVRRESPDLGLWSHLSPADLLIPMDTHVSRISGFLGLTDRKDASWRTAEEITARLRLLSPDDPVRYDFALAHIGISEGCLGYRHAEVCVACPLDKVCTA